MLRIRPWFRLSDLTFVIVIACFGLQYLMEDMFRNNKAAEVLNSLSSATGTAGRIYLPIEWFGNSVVELKISDMLLLIGVTLLLFELVFIPVGKSYSSINSALKSHSASREVYHDRAEAEERNNAIAFKEFKRMTGSATYVTNAAIGRDHVSGRRNCHTFVDVDKVLEKTY